MTAPAWEIEEPEPVAIEGSHLLRVPCVSGRQCGQLAVCAPGQEKRALCTACRGGGVTLDAAAREALSGVRTARRYPYVPPRDPTLQECAERDQCPICQITTLNPACTFRGPVKLKPPEMVCKVSGCAHPAPGPVWDLLRLAEDKGWRVQVQHSRGGVMGGAGKQLAPAEMWGVRFRRGAWQGYAVRRGDAWDSVCIAGEDLSPFLALGISHLRDWLADPTIGGALDAWCADIRRARADAALASKVIRCPGPGECALDLVRLAFVPLRMVMGSRQMAPVPDHTHRADGAIKIKNSRAERKTGA